MNRFLFLIFIFSLNSSAFAQKAESNRVEINRIVFGMNQTSWTSRDQQVYQQVLTEIFKKKKISDYSQTNLNDFLLSRLSVKEAELFGLVATKMNISESSRKKLNAFTNTEIDREVEYIAKALALIEIKEAQHKDVVRFNNWFELMKRKHVVRFKASESQKTE